MRSHHVKCWILSAMFASSASAQSVSHSQLSNALQQALLDQRRVWQAAEIADHGEVKGAPGQLGERVEPRMRRSANTLCPSTGFSHVNIYEGWYYRVRTMMQSVVVASSTKRSAARTVRTVCPDWIPSEAASHGGHELRGPLPEPAARVPFPATLVDALQRAATVDPNDEWVLRQYVRVLVDNGDMGRADSVASACAERLPWCGLLRGYVAAASGRPTEALTWFESSLARGSALTRCEWEAIPTFAIAFLQSADKKGWCERNAGSSRAIWWLATPFYSDSVDWRRVEHFARHVRHALSTDLPFDAYYDLRPEKGADVVMAMRLRYGWASHMFWRGKDHEHATNKAVGPDAFAPPYSAPEYTMDRVSTFPLLRVGLTPFTVRDTDYELTSPDSVPRFEWWPLEHFKHPGGMMETVAHQQRALLRRDSTAVFLISSDLSGGRIDSVGSTPVRTALAFTPSPDSVAVLAKQVTTSGTTVVLHGELASPGIVSFEYLVNAGGLAGGRTRMGIDALPTLSGIPPHTCSMSDLMLTRAEALTGAGTSDAFTGLLGNLVLQRPTKLGLVWEGYGFADGDTTEVAIDIAGTNEMSRLRRMGIALRLTDDPTTALGIRWEEPRVPAARTPLATRVPSTSRQLALDIAQLRAGEYIVAVSMKKHGCDIVRSERSFRVVR